MKTAVVLLLAFVALACAQQPNPIAAAGLDPLIAVSNAMGTYTFLVDHLVAVGATNAPTSPAFQTALDALMGVFCPQQQFRGWINWFGGAVVANFTTVNQTRAFYTEFGSVIMKNISNHVLGSPSVTFIDENHVSYVSKVTHHCFNAAYSNYVPPPVWSADYGHYTNTYLIGPGGEVCMQQFIEYGLFVEMFAPNAPVVTLVDLAHI